MSKQGEVKRLLIEVASDFREAEEEFRDLVSHEEISEGEFLDVMAEGHCLLERRAWRLRRIHQLLVTEEAECDSGK